MDASPTIHNSVLPDNDSLSGLSRESLASLADYDFGNIQTPENKASRPSGRPSLAYRRSSDFRAESIAARLTLAQHPNDHDILRATFLMWKNYTSIKANRRMKKHYEQLVRNSKVSATKNRILTSSFAVLGIMGVCFFFLCILYYNFLMFQPYIVPMVLGLLVAIPLGILKDHIVDFLEWFERKIDFRSPSHYHSRMLLCTAGIPVVCCLLSMLFLYITPSLFGLFFFPLFAVLVASVALALRSFRDSVITVALILTAFLVFSFPVYFIIKNCVEESVVATNSIVQYVNENEELQELLQDYKKSVLWNRFVNYTSSWGWEWDESKLNPEHLKRYLVDALQTLGQHANVFFGSTLQVVTNIGSTLASAFVFLTFLFYFILYKNDVWRGIYEVSPFTDEEHEKIYASLRSSVSRIFVCSLSTGLVHFWSTFFCFILTGLELKYVFSAVSAFLSIIPILSPSVVWVPAVVLLLSRGLIWSALMFTLVQLATMFVIDPAIKGYIPGNPTFVGMSIVLGVSTFGITGVLLGPLLAGLIITASDIYTGHYARGVQPGEGILGPDSPQLSSGRPFGSAVKSRETSKGTHSPKPPTVRVSTPVVTQVPSRHSSVFRRIVQPQKHTTPFTSTPFKPPAGSAAAAMESPGMSPLPTMDLSNIPNETK